MFCLSNCSKEGPYLSSPPFPPIPGGRTTLYWQAPSPRKHTWAQGRRALLPTTPSALVISIRPLTPPFGSTPSAPQTWVPKGRDSVPAPRLVLVLGAHLGMKERVLPPWAAAPWPQDNSAASPGRAPFTGLFPGLQAVLGASSLPTWMALD